MSDVLQIVALDAIEIIERLRPVDADNVAAIAASMAEIGMQQPIIVRPVDGSNRLRLVAGAHRVAAAIQLGWDEIGAIVLPVDDAQARVIEIDENLMRRELSLLDRAIFLGQRKGLHEIAHPETAHGKSKRKSRDRKVANLATFSRFSADAARKTGLSERSIRRAAALFSALAPETVALLRLTPFADNQAALQKLADMEDKKAQVDVARKLAEGAARNVYEAALAAGIGSPSDGDPDEIVWRRFCALWERATPRARRMIRDHIAVSDQKTEPKGRRP